MTFWQENYSFIKEIYDMRHTKMAEWMENVEKSISRIMADKVYTSAEFKRERDNFHVSLPRYYEKCTKGEFRIFQKAEREGVRKLLCYFRAIVTYSSYISKQQFKDCRIRV